MLHPQGRIKECSNMFGRTGAPTLQGPPHMQKIVCSHPFNRKTSRCQNQLCLDPRNKSVETVHLKQAWHNKFLTRGVGAPSGAAITGGYIPQYSRWGWSMFHPPKFWLIKPPSDGLIGRGGSQQDHLLLYIVVGDTIKHNCFFQHFS